MRALFIIAVDVVKSGFEGRALIVVIIALLAFFGLLLGTLDLAVVEGSLTAFKLLGNEEGNTAWPRLNGILGTLVHIAVLGFGIIAGSGAAPSLLAPGRVEPMLALPVPRASLVVGTYLGVLFLAASVGAVAAAGIAIIFTVKVGLLPWVPAVGVLTAVIGLAPVYAVMLLAATLVRSAPVGAGVGFVFWLVGLVSSARTEIVASFDSAWVAKLVEVLLAPLPPLAHLITAVHGIQLEPSLGSDALWASGASVVFAAAMVAAAVFVVSSRDY